MGDEVVILALPIVLMHVESSGPAMRYHYVIQLRTATNLFHSAALHSRITSFLLGPQSIAHMYELHEF